MMRYLPNPKPVKPLRDLRYLAAVRKLPCVAPVSKPCPCKSEADHAGKHGTGQRCSDYDSIPLCGPWGEAHHIHRHGHSGPFKGWSKSKMRAWLDQKIAETQEKLASLLLPGRDSNSARHGSARTTQQSAAGD